MSPGRTILTSTELEALLHLSRHVEEEERVILTKVLAAFTGDGMEPHEPRGHPLRRWTDISPQPDHLEVVLGAGGLCRICFLLVERFRHICATIEDDAGMLFHTGVHGVLADFHADVLKHMRDAQHMPFISLVEAMLQAIEQRGRKTVDDQKPPG